MNSMATPQTLSLVGTTLYGGGSCQPPNPYLYTIPSLPVSEPVSSEHQFGVSSCDEAIGEIPLGWVWCVCVVWFV